MQLSLALLLVSTARAAKEFATDGEHVANSHLALLKERWLEATDRSGGVWGPALANWSIAAKRERKENGKFLIAFADDYGLGNRINIVTSTLALAMATGRSLIVLWPHTDCRHTNHGDCDPTSINDLFVENETRAQWGVGSHAHAAISRCRDDVKRHAKPLKRWAIGEEDDRKTAEHLMTHRLGPEWRKEDPYLCTYGFFYWGWALTCNQYLRRAWGLDPNAGNPWAEFGGLMSWLLGDARASIVSRVHKALGDKNIKCDVGMHLRRADGLPGDGTQTENLKWKVHLEEALAGLKSPNVYIAADHESKKTKWMLLHYLEERADTHILTLGHDTKAADRKSRSGLLDALAENFILSSCTTLLPRGTGASTFHDVAVARAAFQQKWNESRAASFAFRRKDRPARPLISPALCADLDNAPNATVR